MSKNINQVYIANPTTTIPDNALVYLGLSPYAASNDSAIKSQDIFPASGTVNNGDVVFYSGTSGKKFTNKTLTNGQLLIGQTGDAPIGAALTAGTRISITNGAGSITIASTMLTSANTFTAAQGISFVNLTDAATVAIDSSLSNNFNLTLGGNRTLGVPTNMVAGRSGVITVRQDGTGSRTLAYSWVYQFPGGVAPILSTGALSLDQLNYMINAYATSTVTITIAAPGVVTWASHGLVSGQRIQLTTTGALPTGLSASTTYWVTVIDANTFKLSTSFANAQAGTFITTTGSQSGVHTAVNASITVTINQGLA